VFYPKDGSSKFLLNILTFYQTIQWHIPDDSDIHIHCHENLKFYNVKKKLLFIGVFRVMTLYSLVENYQFVWRNLLSPYHLHLHRSTVKMEAAGSSKPMVTFHQAGHCHILEGSNLHVHWCKNPMSHNVKIGLPYVAGFCVMIA
jgi:hypothetical protein